MSVHPEIAAFLSTLPPSDSTPPDVAGWRAMGESHLPPLEERLPLFDVEDTFAGPVPIRIYTPVDAVSFGVLVYFHGGAFFSGSLETHDGIARSISDASGYKVISVGYRLAPEAQFPAGLDDCYSVVKWVVDNASYLKWDGNRLALAGDSSGGNFVAAATGLAQDQGFDAITQQILLYPSVDLDFDLDRYPSLTENAVGKGLETITLKPFNSYYINSGANPDDPRVSPIKRASFAGLPEAFVVTAENDPLRDEGELYAQRLQDAGVSTKLMRYEGATHGFVQYFAWLPEYSSIFQEIARFLK